MNKFIASILMLFSCFSFAKPIGVISDEEGDVGQLPMNLVQPIDNV